MNQYLILLLTYLIGFNAVGQLQDNMEFEYKVLYDLKYQLDSLDKSSSKIETMVLLIGDDSSKFSSFGKHIKDSILNEYKDKPRTPENFSEYKSKVPDFNHKYVIYKNYLKEKIFFTEKIAGDNFLYKEPINDLKWEIKDDLKNILGYNVQKAVTKFRGREYIAWFAKEIPLSNGPYKFGGLPGLIIKIHDINNYYVFELKAFKKLKDSVLEEMEMSNLVLSNRDEFVQLKKDYKQNPMAIYESSGRSFNFNSSAQKEKILRDFRQRMKKQNNPIELE